MISYVVAFQKVWCLTYMDELLITQTSPQNFWVLPQALDKANKSWRKDKQTRNGKFEAIVPIFLLQKSDDNHNLGQRNAQKYIEFLYFSYNFHFLCNLLTKSARFIQGSPNRTPTCRFVYDSTSTCL